VRRTVLATAVSAAVLAIAGPVSATPSAYGPQLPDNPYDGPTGTGSMHGDSGASDTTPLPGPGTGPVLSLPITLGAACPTIMVGSDGLPLALCTEILGRNPQIYLLSKSTGLPLATLPLTSGSLLGGVYAFIDQADRLVLVDGSNNLIRVSHTKNLLGLWQLAITQTAPLGGAVPTGDAVASLTPAYDGKVWFATSHGTVGTVDTAGVVRTIALPAGEQVANSISSSPDGTAVTTTHALYLIDDPSGTPVVRFRVPYDRGSARKPGMLSWGSGSTPTFFGPTDGGDYLAIVDNADGQNHLMVVDVATGATVCTTPVLVAGGDASENSPIGAGRSVFVASTYGYPYPATPEDAGPAVPATAVFSGGMSRVDVRADGSGCDLVWDNTVRSAAVPKLSIADGTITTITRHNPAGDQNEASAVDTFSYAVVDPETGNLLAEQIIAATTATDPLQTAGTTAPGRVLYQGTLSGLLRITPVG
jgi:hypothetical protein